MLACGAVRTNGLVWVCMNVVRVILFWKRRPLEFIRFSKNLTKEKNCLFVVYDSLYVYNHQHKLGKNDFCKTCTLLTYGPILHPQISAYKIGFNCSSVKILLEVKPHYILEVLS